MLVQLSSLCGTQGAQVKWEDQAWQSLEVPQVNMYQAEIAHFARCILRDESPIVTGEDGRAALVLLEARRTGQVVKMET